MGLNDTYSKSQAEILENKWNINVKKKSVKNVSFSIFGVFV